MLQAPKLAFEVSQRRLLETKIFNASVQQRRKVITAFADQCPQAWIPGLSI